MNSIRSIALPKGKIMIKVTVIALDGEKARVTLPKPHYVSDPRGPEDAGTGRWVTGLYVGPRTGRFFLRTYSIWMRSHNDSRVIGTVYQEIGLSEYLTWCDVVGVEPSRVQATEV